jgi:DNA-directed RNA polymerase beta' subunit
MVYCPVCGKWLKNAFALNGHIRLKEDALHYTYFENYYKNKSKKNTTITEIQLQELITLFKKQNKKLSKQYDDIFEILQLMNKLFNKFDNKLFPPTNQPQPTFQQLSTIQQIPNFQPSATIQSQPIATESEKKLIRDPTFTELLKKYDDDFEEIYENYDENSILKSVDIDPRLSLEQKKEIKREIKDYEDI